MSLIPEEEFQKSNSLNLAPMVDFLFLVVAIFATMAISRAALYDTEVNLVQVKPEKEASIVANAAQPQLVNISITAEGQYKWLTEVSEFIMEGPESICKELQKQQQVGLIPKDPRETKILLHIDKQTKWEPIAEAIFMIREAGFPIHPVYEPVDLSQ